MEPKDQDLSKPVEVLSIDGAILKTFESVSVAAQVPGIINQMSIKEGSKVTATLDVGHVNDTAVRLQAEKAKVAYLAAKKKKTNDIEKRLAMKSKAVAENEYLRAVGANNRVSGTYEVNEIERLKLIFDRTVLEIEKADYLQSMLDSEVALAEIEVRQSIDLYQRHRILSPCEGTVVSIEKRVGEWVEPGTILFKVVNTQRLRIEGFLNSKAATPELVGSKAKVSVENGDSVIESTAEIVFVSPDANPLNGEVRIFLELDNSDGILRPGLRPTITIIK